MQEKSRKNSRKTYFSLDDISDSEAKGILIRLLKEKFKLTEEEIRELVKKEEEILVPISIFKNKLSTLEIIVKYLKENYNFRFQKIADLLNRNYRTIYSAYRRALRKNIPIVISESKINVPLSIFKDRKFSALESIVKFLKEEFQLRYSEIALMLNLDQRTIWTVYKRCKKKI